MNHQDEQKEAVIIRSIANKIEVNPWRRIAVVEINPTCPNNYMQKPKEEKEDEVEHTSTHKEDRKESGKE